ncbi:DUF3027 domain-containing protein [Arthrobacter sp. H35-D1]|uniref:DUF3027 domain-containing protein n=1 Tax=Arthrobacter sp. H35-D1 TaxID=3046202 RepID=UPI0024BB812F|nr:DUF3027 domain-containing protein [Arthrobacter sp. H35-D1]MDJ0314471.1 DUF3027 domain-containing protein [Arthrobacter sp. H35-D1]
MTELSGESAASSAPIEASRPGVPVWRLGKPDAILAADAATARTAVQEIAGPDDIGAHLGARSEGIRCVTHLFESKKPGYQGWVWFASLSRVARGKGSTVNEVGLLPTNDSVLAPAWVPWSERVLPEDREADAQQAAAAGSAAGTGEEPAPDETAPADAATAEDSN